MFLYHLYSITFLLLLLVCSHIMWLGLHFNILSPWHWFMLCWKWQWCFALLKMSYLFYNSVCYALPFLSCLAIAFIYLRSWNYKCICICEYFGALSIAMISEMNNCHNNIFLILTCSIFNVCSVWMMDTCPCYILVNYFVLTIRYMYLE